MVEERLDMEKHFKTVDNFSCGADDPLNNFLYTDAFQYEDDGYGYTYLVFLDKTKTDIIAFYTLKCNGIGIKLKDEFASIPVIELSRIAINFNYQGRGVGALIFNKFILPKVRAVQENVAAKMIMAFVEPDNENAVKFYTKIGFEKANSEIQNSIQEGFNERCDLYFVNIDKF